MEPQRRPRSKAQEPPKELPRPRQRPREVVVDDQRSRLIAGVARALAEHGYPKLTVEQVIDAAGVSRAAFYEHFANRQEAVKVAHEAIYERFLGIVLRACNSEEEWPWKARAALEATVAFAVEHPDEALLLGLDTLAADAEMARRVLACNDHLADLLSAGRDCDPRGSKLPPLTEKALVGAVSATIVGRIKGGEASRLPTLTPQLVELVLTPFVGIEAARATARPSS